VPDTYTLWRGDVLLGHFTERQPVMDEDRVAGAAGVLIPGPDFAGMSSLSQMRFPMLPGSPVYQDLIEAIDMGVPQVGDHRGPQELEELSEEEARGAPAADIMSVRDANDRDVGADMIVLRLYRIPDQVNAAEIRRQWGVEGDSHELWDVMFSSYAPDGG
jgi:hypothetical protein